MEYAVVAVKMKRQGGEAMSVPIFYTHTGTICLISIKKR